MKQTLFTCDECGVTDVNGNLGNWFMGIATESSYSISSLVIHDRHQEGTCAHLCGSECAKKWGGEAVERITANAVTGRLVGGTAGVMAKDKVDLNNAFAKMKSVADIYEAQLKLEEGAKAAALAKLRSTQA